MPYDDGNGYYYGAADYELSAGDRVTWYYMDHRGAYYTIIDNYGSISSSYDQDDDIEIDVKGEYMEDGWNFIMSEFQDLSGATVNLINSSGTAVDTDTTDVNGDATLTVPSSAPSGTYYIMVDSKIYSSGTYEDLLEHVSSWKKTITVD